MGINVSKLFGSNIIPASRSYQAQRVVTNPVQNRNLYASMNSLDRTYGQSPAVADWYNAHELLGSVKYNDIVVA